MMVRSSTLPLAAIALVLSGCAIQAPPTVASPAAIADDAEIGPREVDALPHSEPTATIAYGDDPRQFGELRVPAGKGPFPVTMLVHGGCYTKGFATQVNMAPLASRLTELGFATWNIDYRELGDLETGWPAMMQDWAAGAAKLKEIAPHYRLDLDRLSVIGHSAGVTAAYWLGNGATGLDGVDPTGVPAFTKAVLLDGIMDMPAAVGPDQNVCGRAVVEPLMGGPKDVHADRYAAVSPTITPARIPMLAYSGSLQRMHPQGIARAVSISNGMMRAATATSDDHFRMTAPGTRQYSAFEPELLAFLRAR